jgi:hypothetical protein
VSPWRVYSRLYSAEFTGQRTHMERRFAFQFLHYMSQCYAAGMLCGAVRCDLPVYLCYADETKRGSFNSAAILDAIPLLIRQLSNGSFPPGPVGAVLECWSNLQRYIYVLLRYFGEPTKVCKLYTIEILHSCCCPGSELANTSVLTLLSYKSCSL